MGDGRWQFGCRSLTIGGMGRRGDWETGRLGKLSGLFSYLLPFTFYLLPFTFYLLPLTHYPLPLTSHLNDPVTKPAPVGFDYFMLCDKVDDNEDGKNFGCPAMSGTCLRCACGTDWK